MNRNNSVVMQLKIELRNITKPPVWRRLQVPSDVTFFDFHCIIQAAFGWYNEHKFKFQHKSDDTEWTIGVPETGDDTGGTSGMLGAEPGLVDARSTNMWDFLKAKNLDQFVYIYDLDDCWLHDVTIENVSADLALLFPRCIGGKGACPPEACGGALGYQKMKDKGEIEDPNYFDLDKTDTCVLHYRSVIEAGDKFREKGYDFDGEEDDQIWMDMVAEVAADADACGASEYTYKHPDYPKSLVMDNPWVGEELCKPENAIGLNDRLVKRIMALPADSLRQDLERLIMYHVGLTCDGITEDYDPGDRFNGVIGSALILLGEVGNGESSLDVVLEVMRQSSEFSDYHLSDVAEDLLIPTICKLGKGQFDKLLAYAKEPGLYCFLQCQVFVAMRVMAFYAPELRPAVVAWFRDVLRHYTLYSQSHDVDGELMGFLVSDVTDLHAPELLPDVKALFDSGVVCDGIPGDYNSVECDIKKRKFTNPVSLYNFNAEARFKELKNMYDL